MTTSNRTAASVTKSICLLLGLATALASGSAQPGGAQTPGQANAILTDKDAYLLLPAEIVAGPVVALSSRSPQGGNVAVLRTNLRLSPENIPSAARPNPAPPRMEQELIFWNATIRRPVALWQSVDPHTQVTLSEWMPTTESLFAIVQRAVPPDPQHPDAPAGHEWKLLLLGQGVERAVVVPTPQITEGGMRVEVSPVKPVAVLQLVSSKPDQAPVFILLHPNGRVGARIQAPAASNFGLMWDAAGNPVLTALDRNTAAARAYYSVDPRTGQTKALPKAPQEYALQKSAPPVLPFHAVSQRQDLKMADSVQQSHPIWLESLTKSERQRALLTADGENVSLLSDASGALFTTQNALWFTPILKVGKAEYMAARSTAMRAVAISNAKQLGLATHMYAQDNDDSLPGPDGIEASLNPYLKNSTLFEDFTYTYSGGKLTDITSPAEAILGHVTGPGGRALIYADGHVKWSNE